MRPPRSPSPWIFQSRLLISKENEGFKMTNHNVLLPIKKISKFCKEHPIITKLSLFGSALSGTLRKDSDIDLLVEFEPGKTPSLFVIIDLEDELATILGRKTDLRTPEELSPYFRNEVLAQARSLYVKS